MTPLLIILALAIGCSLGLMGGGGSILTVPVLIYGAGIVPLTASSYSLCIVGCAALVGAGLLARRGNVEYKTALIFSVPSFLAVYMIRKYLLPFLPDPILIFDRHVVSKNIFILSTFVAVMIFAGTQMIINAGRPDTSVPINLKIPYIRVILDALLVGSTAGFVGAGGGFLIIPALVSFLGLPMRLAVGTSLLIIGINSLMGFAGDLQNHVELNAHFLFYFTLLTCIGVVAGAYFSDFIEVKRLKQTFGWFVLSVAFFIAAKEILQ